MAPTLYVLPGEPCPEVVKGKCPVECAELKILRDIQKQKGFVQALCKTCGRVLVITPNKP